MFSVKKKIEDNKFNDFIDKQKIDKRHSVLLSDVTRWGEWVVKVDDVSQ